MRPRLIILPHIELRVFFVHSDRNDSDFRQAQGGRVKTRIPARKKPENRGRLPEGEDAAQRRLQWASLQAALIRGDAVCIDKHRQKLKAAGETDFRFEELARWKDSPAFTEAEKAAIALGESIARAHCRTCDPEAIKEARRHLSSTEIVRLTLAVMAVNDWITLHSQTARRILVVEDDPHDQELLRRQLQRSGVEERVVFLSNGLEACEKLTGPEGKAFREGLTAIFLDVRLPGMSGIELLRRLRALPDMADFPVTVMTSSNDPRDMEECRKLNVRNYAAKPLTYAAFSNAVAHFFD